MEKKELMELATHNYGEFSRYITTVPFEQTEYWPEWMKRLRDMNRQNDPISCRCPEQLAFEDGIVLCGDKDPRQLAAEMAVGKVGKRRSDH